MICSKSKTYILVIFILAVLLLWNVFNYISIIKVDEKYNLKVRAVSAMYWVENGQNTIEKEDVEIFDVKKGKVIKTLPINDEVYNEARKILNGVTSIYVKFDPLPENGYIIRIPLKHPIKIENKFFNHEVDIVYILLPEKESPFLMILDEEDRPYFYNFEIDTKTLLKLLDFCINP